MTDREMNGKRALDEDHIEEGSTHLPRRRKTSHYSPTDAVSGHENDLSTLEHDCYTIAWICALHIERAAAQAMLDEVHSAVRTYANDSNTYTLGSIGPHNVVIACLPNAQYGTNNAANVLTNLIRTFKSIRLGLIVGIGGGVPGKVDIRLGDIVVGIRVMQYDLGKIVEDGEIQRAAIPKIPHPLAGTAISALRSKHYLSQSCIPAILREKLGEHTKFGRPDLPDRLFTANSRHISSTTNCGECDESELVPRGIRLSFDPVIHYGVVASGNQVMRSGTIRDKIARELDAICFEMEAAGLMDIWPCLPIRGICDYSDAHKNKEWQSYAAATAAAYARELLLMLPNAEAPKKLSNTVKSEQALSYDRRMVLLDSLRYEQIDSRKLDIRSAYKKTCSWFLKHQDYQAWLDPAQLSEHCGFLWIRGKPGAGKSTIMKFLYNETRKNTRDAVVASFFFHARGGTLEKSISGMYRSLLLQLLEGYPDLQTVFDDTELIPQNQSECPHLNVLKDLFSSAVFNLGQRPFTCFIDALDECDEQEIRTMVQDIEDLAERSTAMGTPFRICFSSRHYPYIDIDRGIKLTLENQSGHSHDLESYVKTRLKMGKGVLAEQLRSQILQKAAGVFLWVVLVVDILNKENSRGRLAIQKRLSELPSDLSALFKDMLQRDNENMEELLLCVIWILYAKQPLKPDEYYHALWCGLSLKSLVDKEIPDVSEPNADATINNCVTSSSKGLAEITKSKRPTVQFIHESVRDFLIKDKGLQQLWPDHGIDLESLSHERLKECCNWYMSRYFLVEAMEQLKVGQEANQTREISANYPFLEYASQNILFHANGAARAIPQNNFLSTFAVPDWIDTLNLFEKFRTRRYQRNTSLLYILAERNLANLIRIHPDRVSCFKIERERYGPPLFAALALGSHEAAQALLEAQAHVSQESQPHELCKRYSEQIDKRITLGRSFEFSKKKGIFAHMLESGGDILPLFLVYSVDKNRPDIDDRLGSSPLSHAARLGREESVRALLERNIDTFWGDLSRMPPLHHAASHGDEAIFRLLFEKTLEINSSRNYPRDDLSREWDDGEPIFLEGGCVNIDSRDGNGRTPLSHAASNGNEAIIRALLEQNVDCNYEDSEGRSPLSYAIQAGHEAAVQLLLEKGADVGIGTYSWGTILHSAVTSGKEAIVRLLLEKSVDINMRNMDGETALHKAAYSGDKTMVQLFLDGSADADPKDHDGFTPLFEAASRGHLKIVQQLLATGKVDPDSKDNYGRTPLLSAAEAGHQGVVLELLSIKHVNPDSRDNRGKTPLSAACDSSKDTAIVVEELLATGRVDPNSECKSGYTPLIYASWTGKEMVVQQLLAINSVNPNHQNKEGNTALMVAVRKGRTNIVRQLLAVECVDPDHKNHGGITPLLEAVQTGKQTIVQQLLDTGRVNLDSKDVYGNTPLSVAFHLNTRDTERGEILRLLQNHRDRHLTASLTAGV
ncbi:hypothetical protein TWF506_009228 [Arthrobotrys conoides]|uniref:Nucleoside phosphorylase domain-containing protein n=1 Tax=Arthrobotrys conoides TaxID=74498 RepID=A0AAN8N8D4_9PEZI